MKRFLLAGLMCLCAVNLQAQSLKADTATKVNVVLTNASTGAAITGITITNLSIRKVKHSDTLGATTELEACQASGTGDHDCAEIGNGVYEVEIPADNVSEAGRFEVCPVYTTVQAVVHCKTYMVEEAVSYNHVVGGDVATAASIVSAMDGTSTQLAKLGTPDTDISSMIRRGTGVLVSTTIATVTSQTILILTAGPPDNDVAGNQAVAQFTDASNAAQRDTVPVCDYTGASLTLTLCRAPAFTVAIGDQVTIRAVGGGQDVIVRGEAYADYPIFMRSAVSADTGITGQTVTCTRSIAGAAFAAIAGTITEIGVGHYKISSITAAEAAGRYLILTCTGTGGSGVSQRYTQYIFTQQ